MALPVYGFYSACVILAAYLVIFLPVDLLVPEHSQLRQPRWAALCGFLAGSCVPGALCFVSFMKSGSWSLNGFSWQAIPWLLSPGITGMVAAWVRNKKA